MTTYAKRKLKYLRDKNFILLHYVEWDRFVTLVGYVIVSRDKYDTSYRNNAFEVKKVIK
jgi:hypothetical protein